MKATTFTNTIETAYWSLLCFAGGKEENRQIHSGRNGHIPLPLRGLPSSGQGHARVRRPLRARPNNVRLRPLDPLRLEALQAELPGRCPKNRVSPLFVRRAWVARPKGFVYTWNSCSITDRVNGGISIEFECELCSLCFNLDWFGCKLWRFAMHGGEWGISDANEAPDDGTNLSRFERRTRT